MKKLKKKLAVPKPRDFNMKHLIMNKPKQGAFVDQKKQANKDACREDENWDDEE